MNFFMICTAMLSFYNGSEAGLSTQGLASFFSVVFLFLGEPHWLKYYFNVCFTLLNRLIN